MQLMANLNVITSQILCFIILLSWQQVSSSQVRLGGWGHCNQVKQDVIHVDKFSLSRETRLPGDVVFNALLDFQEPVPGPIGVNFRLFTKIWILFFPIWQEVDCRRLGGSCWYPNACTNETCPVTKGYHVIQDYHYNINGDVPSRSFYIELMVQEKKNSRIPYTCYGIYFDVVGGVGQFGFPDENMIVIFTTALLMTLAILLLIFIRIKGENAVKYAVLA